MTPKVSEVARKYFNCDSIPGIALEDEGGEGTASGHWEERLVYSEAMTSTNVRDPVYSDFTFAWMEDSGYYKVNWAYSE